MMFAEKPTILKAICGACSIKSYAKSDGPLAAAVDSACKQYRHRFVDVGMRGSGPGSETLLPVRSAILSRRFGQVWSSVYKPPLN